MLADFADRAKNEYIENFFRIDERLASLTRSTRESRNLERTASQTRAVFDEREDVALGRELKQLIESGEAEKLMNAERVGRAGSVRDFLPEDVRERAREAASRHNEREAHEMSLFDLRETLEEREQQPGEIAPCYHLSSQFTVHHDGSDVPARKVLQEDSTKRTHAYNDDKEIIAQNVNSTGERTHQLSIFHSSQPAKSNTEHSSHKPTAPEIAADARDQHFRHYVLTR